VIGGLRVHLSGSAAYDCDGNLLRAAHSFVRALSDELITRGGGFVLGVGGDPLGAAGESCLFDWTALEAVATAPDPAPQWPSMRPERFVVVSSQRALGKLPAERVDMWERCIARSDFALEVAPPGWRMAGIIRERQVLRGDVLLALGGGAGVEHLAELYRNEGKSVISVYAEIGALNDDGNGGSRFLHRRALADIDHFVRLRDGAGNAAARLTQLRLAVDGDTTELARRTADLLDDLRPRPAFYVRLLATDHPDYDAVERFFRDVVDPVVADNGFTPYEMGRGRPETAFMNVEIFEGLHRAGLVVVDLSGVRPNCMMELGYALGRSRRVVISAKVGTQLAFDQDKLATHFWDEGASPDERRSEYRAWFDRYSELPPIVEPTRL
jgi:ATP nucleosidase Cap17-like, N-terminal